MSEFEPKYENDKRYEIDPKAEQEQEKRVSEHHEKAAAEAEAAGRESYEKLQERVEKEAQSREKIAAAQSENKASESAIPIGKDLKDHAFNQNIRRAQKQMPALQRQFSKFIHKRGVEAASNVGATTVARPSGLLVGGLFSVISSLVILYVCRHYGYEYNFFVGLVSFAGGFVLGVVVEGLYKLVKRRR